MDLAGGLGFTVSNHLQTLNPKPYYFISTTSAITSYGMLVSIPTLDERSIVSFYKLSMLL